MPTKKIRILPHSRVLDTVAGAMAAHPVTVISAPMGYGKTVLARALVENEPTRSHFIATPPGTYHAGHLWNAILTLLADAGLEKARMLRRVGFPENPHQLRRVFSHLRDASDAAMLVVDDYHHVADPAIDAFLGELARADLPAVRIVLLSRTRPGMHLEELRLKGYAAVFDQSLLAFTGEETRNLFRLHGCGNAKAAETAWKRSEGWPAILWLCLQGWRERGVALPARDIEALLAETVYDTYDDEERAFLLRVSVLDDFSAGEAEMVSSDPEARQRLRSLHGKNAFLGHDAASGAYRFHPIFRDFLEKERAAAGINLLALYRLAGECCVNRGDPIQALRFFRRSGRDADLVRLLDLFLMPGARNLLAFHHGETAEAVQATPWPLRLEQPVGYLAFIHYSLSDADDPRAAPLLDEAEGMFRSALSLPAPIRTRLDGEAALVRALMAYDDPEALFAYAGLALRRLAGPSDIVGREAPWTFGCPHASGVFVRAPGEYRRITEIWGRDSHLIHEVTDGCGAGSEPLLLAEYLLERGDFDRVEPLLAESIRRAEPHRQMATILACRFCLARLRLSEGKPDAATALLESWRPMVEGDEESAHAACLDLALGYVFACLERPCFIPRWIRNGAAAPERRSPARVRAFRAALHARALLLASDYERAHFVARDVSVRNGGLFPRLHATIVEAVASRHRSGLEEALFVFRIAIDLARPDGILQSVAEYGGRVLPLVRQLRKEDSADPYLKDLLALTERMTRVASKRGRAQRGLLTARQEEAMRLVCRGKSNPEIGRMLGIAEVTVKKILSFAYVRLGAGNRAEAARRFEMMIRDGGLWPEGDAERT